jgi:hypothetical protein
MTHIPPSLPVPTHIHTQLEASKSRIEMAVPTLRKRSIFAKDKDLAFTLQNTFRFFL